MKTDVAGWLSECIQEPITKGDCLALGELPAALSSFESKYIAIRKKEGRMYDVSEVQRLPMVPRHHPHYKEWKIREHSLGKLKNHLQSRPQPWKLLDIGCGNGWMSAQLAQMQGSNVLGLDVGKAELEQAQAAFGGKANLVFAQGSIFSESLKPNAWDYILLAGAVQYFEDVKVLVNRLLELLKPNGEIHILDSPFYTPETQPTARKNTQAYYESEGFPELAAFYHAHLLTDLSEFHPQFFYDPQDFSARFMRIFPWSAESPFPWLVIRKDEM